MWFIYRKDFKRPLRILNPNDGIETGSPLNFEFQRQAEIWLENYSKSYNLVIARGVYYPNVTQLEIRYGME